MPLLGVPLLEYQLSYLRDAGVSEVCFATNYMSDEVRRVFGDGSNYGMRLYYAVEDEPLDTAGAIRNAYEAIPGDDCVIFNGDVIHGFDISDIIAGHFRRDADVTLTLRSVLRPHAYGVVPLNEDGSVTGFLEPSEEQKRNLDMGSAGEDFINAGLYVMSKDSIETIPHRRCNIEREIFPKLIGDGWKVYGDVRDDFWIDIGRPSQYLTAADAIINERVRGLPGVRAVSEDAIVAGGAFVENSSLGSASRVEAGARVTNSALLENVVIGENALVDRSIIGEGCIIGANAIIRDSVLPASSRVDAFARLGSLE